MTIVLKAIPWLQQKHLPLIYILLVIEVLTADYLTGPLIQFPILYLVPVGLAAWFHGRRWGYGLAIFMAFTRLFFFGVWGTPWGLPIILVNALIRLIVFSGFVFLIDKTAVQHRLLEKEVRILSGLLPICSFCKKIRDEEQQWQPLEIYISAHSEADFSHGLCSDCAQKHYPDFYADISAVA
ncbi:MAG: hypothetical protein KDJ65_11185 [Anaerolineae bacterium]|nr:hypothetical protein [Anaerolineae bacterium]